MISFGTGMRNMMGMPTSMGYQSAPNPFSGGGGTGGFGSWIRDPGNQQLIAGILSGVGGVIGEERKLGHQRDILNFEKKVVEDEDERRREIAAWLRSAGV